MEMNYHSYIDTWQWSITLVTSVTMQPLVICSYFLTGHVLMNWPPAVYIATSFVRLNSQTYRSSLKGKAFLRNHKTLTEFCFPNKDFSYI